ncbi:hypothetical protein [Mycobacterium sp. Root265]|uniref:hypothetical protein n=1 Tax=Mycobacterium sp. Root265 TaxID=1736504 RepID=UPI0009E6BA7C|nr:hypothetical protein [Mycobacterium sp. Root265]
MKIPHVERWTIPILHPFGRELGNTDPGTKVRDLYAALEKLPNGAHVSVDHGGSSLQVTYVHPDLEVN